MAPGRRHDGPAGYPPPLKRLGQHFLSDPRILDRIVDTLALDGSETVVEIGPGRGGLTDRIAPRAARVVVIEIDRALAGLLRTKYAGQSKVEVIEADALTVSFADAARGLGDSGDTDRRPGAFADSGDGGYVVVGNVPYYITTPLLFHSLVPPRPSRAVFLVQREVAERIVAPAGSESYGALSANVQAIADARIMFRVPPGAFQPPPKVDSAVIRIASLGSPVITRDEEGPFRKLVQGAFGLRRKQMRKVVRTLTGLSAVDAERILESSGVDAEARPETLAPERFAAILRALRDKNAELRDDAPGLSPDS
jgi:16S rRNA (adenine1518-N6/adenine1519-N6)-dimethyltransferase